MRARRERDGRELGIIGIDNPHNVSVSRMNAHFPICVVSPRERERESEEEGEEEGRKTQKSPGRTGIPQSLYSPHCQFQSATYGVARQ